MPLNELMQPAEGLAVAIGHAALLFVLPMRRDAAFGHSMHLIRADLEFDVLALGTDHSRMERLIEIGFRNRDVVLESARHRPPQRMNHPHERVAVHLRIGHDAQGGQIVHLLERDRLLVHLLINAVEMFGPAVDLPGQTVLLQRLRDQLDDLLNVLLPVLVAFGHAGAHQFIDVRLEVLETEVFQFVLDPADAEPVGQRRINLQRFLRDVLPLRLALRCSSVRMLCRRSANLMSTTRMSSAIESSILRKFSACFSSWLLKRDLADFRDAIDEMHHVLPELALEFFGRGHRVFQACRGAVRRRWRSRPSSSDVSTPATAMGCCR